MKILIRRRPLGSNGSCEEAGTVDRYAGFTPEREGLLVVSPCSFSGPLHFPGTPPPQLRASDSGNSF